MRLFKREHGYLDEAVLADDDIETWKEGAEKASWQRYMRCLATIFI